MKAKSKIKVVDFISMFLRSFLMQAVWNYKSLLSVGFCFTLIPAARRMCSNRDEFRKFIKRHLSFFNAHPYFASYAVGAIARLEEDRAEKNETETEYEEKIEKFKNALMGPLGAVGDHYFWAVLKPAALLVAVALVALSKNFNYNLLAIGLALGLYNLPHFYIRGKGIIDGYNEGYGIYKSIRLDRYSRMLTVYQVSGAFALGIFMGHHLILTLRASALPVIIFVISIVIAYFMRNKKQSMYRSILIPVLIALGAGLL